MEIQYQQVCFVDRPLTEPMLAYLMEAYMRHSISVS